MSDKIKLVVGGMTFVTCRSTLNKYPNTKLGRLTDDQYFFDRSWIMFDSILNYYRTGLLEKPPIASDKAWNLELQFWELHVKPFQLYPD